MVWLADPDKLQGYSANYKTVKRPVEEYGISLIVLADNIKTKEIADLTGISYQGIISDRIKVGEMKFSISGNHFITSEAMGITLPDSNQLTKKSIPEANGITAGYQRK